MDYATFVSRYPRTPRPAVDFGDDRDGWLALPRSFAIRFGELLHDHLSGARTEVLQARLRDLLSAYVGWLRSRFASLIRTVEYRGVVTGDQSSSLPFLFHHLNQPLLDMWPYVVVGSPQVNRLDARRMRMLLALAALSLGRVRDGQVSELGYFSPEFESLRSVHSGMLSEFDTAVLLMEIVREHPGLAVLPAPPQFEQSTRGANVDLLVLDTRRKQIVGVQVKTRLRGGTFGRYEEDAVVLIDGDLDLGNTRRVRTDPRRSDAHAVTWPGLISAHVVADIRPGTVGLEDFETPRLLALRRIARRLCYGTSSYTKDALRHISDRILERLEPVA